MPGTILTTCEERPELALNIFLDPYFTHVIDQIRESIGNTSVESGWIGPRNSPRRTAPGICAAIGEMEEGRGEMRTITAEPGRGREIVGFSQCGGFELQATPGPHFLPRQYGRAGFCGVHRGQNGARKRRCEKRGGATAPTPSSILVQLNRCRGTVHSCRDEWHGPSAFQGRLEPFLRRPKLQVPRSIRDIYVSQFFLAEFQAARGDVALGFSQNQFQGVLQEGTGRFRLLAEIIGSDPRDDHFRRESHPFVIAIADTVKEVSRICRAPPSDRFCSLHQGQLCQCAQEAYRVEKV